MHAETPHRAGHRLQRRVRRPCEHTFQYPRVESTKVAQASVGRSSFSFAAARDLATVPRCRRQRVLSMSLAEVAAAGRGVAKAARSSLRAPVPLQIAAALGRQHACARVPASTFWRISQNKLLTFGLIDGLPSQKYGGRSRAMSARAPWPLKFSDRNNNQQKIPFPETSEGPSTGPCSPAPPPAAEGRVLHPGKERHVAPSKSSGRWRRLKLRSLTRMNIRPGIAAHGAAPRRIAVGVQRPRSTPQRR